MRGCGQRRGAGPRAHGTRAERRRRRAGCGAGMRGADRADAARAGHRAGDSPGARPASARGSSAPRAGAPAGTASRRCCATAAAPAAYGTAPDSVERQIT